MPSLFRSRKAGTNLAPAGTAPPDQQKDGEKTPEIDEDELQLLSLGYKQVLSRSWGRMEAFSSSFVALNVAVGVRTLLFFALPGGGPKALWINWIINGVFMTLTAAVLAEVCSAFPAAGSIYYYVYRLALPPSSVAPNSLRARLSRLAGWVAAWWTLCGWLSYLATDCLSVAQWITSQPLVFGLGDVENGNIWSDGVGSVRFRAVEWAIAVCNLIFCTSINFLSPKIYRYVFGFSLIYIFVDLLFNLIAVPIGISRSSSGFNTAEFVFLETFEGTGNGNFGMNWLLGFYLGAGCLAGFDAAGHIAEETKHASELASFGIFYSALSVSIIGFPFLILYLFCIPGLDNFLSSPYPQPFVTVYLTAFGRGGQVVAIIIAILGHVVNTTVSIVAVSRLMFAIARDGRILPFSSWLARVNHSTAQPHNAVIGVAVIVFFMICTILPSEVAFTSLTSAAVVNLVACYGLVALLRFLRGSKLLFPSEGLSSAPAFVHGKWSIKPKWLGTPMAGISSLWCLFIVIVLCLPEIYPVSGQNLNYASVIFIGITVLSLISFLIAENAWFHPETSGDTKEGGEETETETEKEAEKTNDGNLAGVTPPLKPVGEGAE